MASVPHGMLVNVVTLLVAQWRRPGRAYGKRRGGSLHVSLILRLLGDNELGEATCRSSQEQPGGEKMGFWFHIKVFFRISFLPVVQADRPSSVQRGGRAQGH